MKIFRAVHQKLDPLVEKINAARPAIHDSSVAPIDATALPHESQRQAIIIILGLFRLPRFHKHAVVVLAPNLATCARFRLERRTSCLAYIVHPQLRMRTFHVV